jgi:hypothetical protein
MRPEITRITFYRKDNFVIFNDTDLMTDYFHSYSLGQAETADWINGKGADIITIHVVNEDASIPHLRRVKQICKKCGYEFTDNSHPQYYPAVDVTQKVIEYELRRKVPSLFKVAWWSPVSYMWDLSEAMSLEDAEKRKKELIEHGISTIELRRQPPSL